MVEFPKRYGGHKNLYGWVNPRHSPQCRYLNLKGKEVSISLVTSDPISPDPDMIGVGEVVFCTIDVYGKPRHIPAEVQEWIKAVQEEQQSLGSFLDKIADLAVPIEQTIASLKERSVSKGPCPLAYTGVGACTCGACPKRQLIQNQTNSYGYLPGEIK
jgi:hypothetical protein